MHQWFLRFMSIKWRLQRRKWISHSHKRLGKMTPHHSTILPTRIHSLQLIFRQVTRISISIWIDDGCKIVYVFDAVDQCYPSRNFHSPQRNLLLHRDAPHRKENDKAMGGRNVILHWDRKMLTLNCAPQKIVLIQKLCNVLLLCQQNLWK